MAEPRTHHRAGGGPRDRAVLIRRAIALAAVALVVAGGALVVWRVVGASSAERAAKEFADAWGAERYDDMWRMISPAAQRETGAAAFATAYREAADTATATGVSPGEVRTEGDDVVIAMTIDTRVWGPVREDLRLRLGDDDQIEWSADDVFPGLGRGERLTRETEAPERAAILDRRGDTLVSGPGDDRESTLGEIAGTVAGPTDDDYRAELYRQGFAEDYAAGVGGLELVFEDDVAGVPGGVLRAGERELATAEPRPAEAAQSTIDPVLQDAATGGLAGRIGGVVVLDARTGEVRAVAGGGISNAQAPGSTFKIVSAAAALEAGIVELSTEFPVAGSADIEGFKLKNAHDGELCGGTFVESFAESCNSVFGPVGAELGAERLVDMAERFGLNATPSVAGATESTIPKASEFSGELDEAVTAIGQGRVLVTPLQLASIAQTIAAGGKRADPSFDPQAARPDSVRVVDRKVASEVGDMMVETVNSGTGFAAAIEGVQVAGKTGTAEVGLQTEDEEDDPKDNAWFAAYAPAKKAKLAVAVFVANSGFGGDVAAPVAGQVLAAGLAE